MSSVEQFGDYRDVYPVGTRVQITARLAGTVVDIDSMPTYGFDRTIESCMRYQKDCMQVWVLPDRHSFAWQLEADSLSPEDIAVTEAALDAVAKIEDAKDESALKKLAKAGVKDAQVVLNS